MQPGASNPPQPPNPDVEESATRVASSAQGWHSIQLAVLGFIGICGVLRTGADATGPTWLQWVSALLALLALVLACLATYRVGRVAYPFYGGDPGAWRAQPQEAGRRLRGGIRLTYLAVGALAVASVVAWWPSQPAAAATAAPAAIEVRDGFGAVACGTLLEGPAGTLQLKTAHGTVTVGLGAVASIRPVTGC